MVKNTKAIDKVSTADNEIKEIYEWLDEHRDFMEYRKREFDREIINKSSLDPDFDEDLEYELECQWIEDQYNERIRKIKRLGELHKLRNG